MVETTKIGTAIGTTLLKNSNTRALLPAAEASSSVPVAAETETATFDGL